MDHVMVFFSSYCDFVRLRNWFKTSNLDYAEISEYTKDSRMAKVRPHRWDPDLFVPPDPDPFVPPDPDPFVPPDPDLFVPRIRTYLSPGSEPICRPGSGPICPPGSG